MKPFSAGYFLCKNKGKSLCIILMISMIALAYVGGLYLTNISEETYATLNMNKDFVVIQNSIEDKNAEQLIAAIQEIQEDDTIEMFHTATNYFNFKTILGFVNGGTAYTFSREDFARFNRRMHLIPNDVEMADNTILLTDREATFLNVKEGDFLDTKKTENVRDYWGKNPYRVITFNRNVLSAYFVVDDIDNSSCFLVTWKDSSQRDQFYLKIAEYKSKYDRVTFSTGDERLAKYKEDFQINNIIYYSIIAIVSLVCAITINAVFVGIYDKRRQEFMIYQGIGIGNKKICFKIISEILIMNGFGILLGVVFSVITVSFLNEFIYKADGIYMWYYHKTAFLATLFCDLVILIPGIGLRLRRILKDNTIG